MVITNIGTQDIITINRVSGRIDKVIYRANGEARRVDENAAINPTLNPGERLVMSVSSGSDTAQFRIPRELMTSVSITQCNNPAFKRFILTSDESLVLTNGDTNDFVTIHHTFGGQYDYVIFNRNGNRRMSGSNGTASPLIRLEERIVMTLAVGSEPAHFHLPFEFYQTITVTKTSDPALYYIHLPASGRIEITNKHAFDLVITHIAGLFDLVIFSDSGDVRLSAENTMRIPSLRPNERAVMTLAVDSNSASFHIPYEFINTLTITRYDN